MNLLDFKIFKIANKKANKKQKFQLESAFFLYVDKRNPELISKAKGRIIELTRKGGNIYGYFD